MPNSYLVLVGYANGDVHSMQVMKDQQASQMASEEAKQIGQLTNAGFCTVAASAWMNNEQEKAGFMYAAGWNENEAEVLVHGGMKIEGSSELYNALKDLDSLTAIVLLDLCRHAN